MSIADVYGLQRLISGPTRIRPTSESLLDLIYANCADEITCSAWLFSDRRIALNWMSNGDNTVTYRNFRNLTDKAFEMTSYPNLGRTFMDSPFQICAHFWP